MKKFALFLSICCAVLVIGAAAGLWYSEYLTTKNPRLEWDAGLRDSDVRYTLICAYDIAHSINDPNWNMALDIDDPTHAEYFPEVGTSSVVTFPVLDVVNQIGPNQEIFFSIAYVDRSGNISEWATVSHVFDYEAPGAPGGVGVFE